MVIEFNFKIENYSLSILAMELINRDGYPGLPKELQNIIFDYVGWDYISASQISAVN